MRSEDPSFGRFLDDAYAYAVYPAVGKGGFIKVEVTVTKEGDGWKIDQFFAGLFDPHKK